MYLVGLLQGLLGCSTSSELWALKPKENLSMNCDPEFFSTRYPEIQ